MDCSLKKTILGAAYIDRSVSTDTIDAHMRRLADAGVCGISFDSADYALRFDGTFENVFALETELIDLKRLLRGLGIECCDRAYFQDENGEASDGDASSWMYVLRDGKICREPGMVMYRHNLFSEKEKDLILDALRKTGCSEECVEKIDEKFFTIDACLESFPIG